jgi:hypothetical protein
MPPTAPITEAHWRSLGDASEQVRRLPRPADPRKLRLFGCACLQRGREWLSPEGRDALDVAERFAHGQATDAERQDAFRQLVEGCGGYVGPHPAGRPWRTASMPPDVVAVVVALVIATDAETILNRETGRPLIEELEEVSQVRRVASCCRLARELAAGLAQERAEAARSAVGRTWNRFVRVVAGRLTTAPDAATRLHETKSQLALLREIFGNPFRQVLIAPEWRTDTVLTLARQMDESGDFSAMPILADALQDAGCSHVDLLHHCRDTTATHIRGCWVVDLVLGRCEARA